MVVVWCSVGEKLKYIVLARFPSVKCLGGGGAGTKSKYPTSDCLGK